MAEQEGAGGGESEPWWQSPLELSGLAHAGTEMHAAAEASEPFTTLRGSSYGMQAGEAAELEEGGGMGTALAPLALASGINNMINGNGEQKVQGALETTSGAVGTLGTVGETASVLGAEGAGGAMMEAAATLGPVGAVAGAGAAGMAVGNMGNNFMSEHGWIGQNDDGSNRNWSDMASDWGVAAKNWGGDGVLGDVAGVAATAGGSIVGAAGAAGSAVLGVGESIGHGIGSAASAIGSGISSLFSW